MLPKNLYVVRHFHSEGNQVTGMAKQGDDSGYTPEFQKAHSSGWRLTATGRQQSASVREWFAQELGDHQPAKIFVSSYVRAIESAALIFPEGDFFESDYLRERNWGDFDRMPMLERTRQYHKSLEEQQETPFYWRPPNGESISEVCLRADRALETLHREYSDAETVVLVAHGEFNHALDTRIRRVASREYNPSNPKIHNGEILHYTRVREDGVLSHRMEQWRTIWPVKPDAADDSWKPIIRTKLTAQDLLDTVRSYPHFFAENREGV
jgi:broad specificity phosphatase PhoE